VTAVDISQTQLDALGKKCAQFAERIELRCEDVAVALREERCYDIVSALSLLHHIPDYMSLVRQAIARLSPHGQFFSFQDPLRYDTVGAFTNAFSEISYLSWRVFKGDIWGGFTRRVRRSRGVYLPDCLYDNAEYHVTRNGVDQDALCNLSEKLGCSCTIVRYFSTQSGFFQPVGSALKLENTFAVIAQKAPV
jgi:SAM-dependent methyltransferase